MLVQICFFFTFFDYSFFNSLTTCNASTNLLMIEENYCTNILVCLVHTPAIRVQFPAGNLPIESEMITLSRHFCMSQNLGHARRSRLVLNYRIIFGSLDLIRHYHILYEIKAQVIILSMMMPLLIAKKYIPWQLHTKVAILEKAFLLVLSGSRDLLLFGNVIPEQ